MKTLHSILVKSIPVVSVCPVNCWYALHSILVKSILLYSIYRQSLLWSLHSILVKSIQESNKINGFNMSALHSILVKSIQDDSVLSVLSDFLYIPFWLNLYHVFFPAVITIFNLYIPFWLNLYESNKINGFNMSALHSILVKSIPFTDWKFLCALLAFTFHSG